MGSKAPLQSGLDSVVLKVRRFPALSATTRFGTPPTAPTSAGLSKYESSFEPPVPLGPEPALGPEAALGAEAGPALGAGLLLPSWAGNTTSIALAAIPPAAG